MACAAASEQQQQQQESGRRRERRQAPLEDALYAGGKRRGSRQPESPGQLRRGRAAGQFEQGQRVTAGLADDPVPDPSIQPSGQHRGQQRPRIRIRQSLHHEPRKPGQAALPGPVPGAEQQRHRLGVQPPGREPQRLRRRLVQPLRVIDQAQQRGGPRLPPTRARAGIPAFRRGEDVNYSGRGPSAWAAGPAASSIVARRVVSGATGMLMDRVVETGALERVLAAVRDGLSGVLVLRGEAGIGKTVLLDSAVDRAAPLQAVIPVPGDGRMPMPAPSVWEERVRVCGIPSRIRRTSRARAAGHRRARP